MKQVYTEQQHVEFRKCLTRVVLLRGPQAVCCTDHEHCCPQGYTCNMQTATCDKKEQAPLVHVLPQSRVGPSEDDADVACDCPEQESCCRSSASEWACCPSPRVRSHRPHTSS